MLILSKTSRVDAPSEWEELGTWDGSHGNYHADERGDR